MDDLAAWLLERVAEDEVWARERIAEHPEWSSSVLLFGIPTRVLAECEARRRIVEGLVYVDQYDDPDTPVMNVGWFLRLLALPYADKSGYREEWRP